MFVSLAFVAFFVAIVGFAWLGIWRYRTVINPLTLHCLSQTLVFSFVSGLVTYYLLPGHQYSDEAAVFTILCCIAYLTGVALPHLLRLKGLEVLYGQVMGGLRLTSTRTPGEHRTSVQWALAGAALLSYLLLMVVSGGGTVWLTDTRQAYATYKPHALPLWLLYEWCITLSLAYYMWTMRPRGWRLAMCVGCACVAAYFAGSKGGILDNVVLATIFYHFRIRPLPLAALLAGVAGVFVVSLALVVLQGTNVAGEQTADVRNAVLYYQDYFDTAAQFISRFNEFGYRYGTAWLSYFWFFVPRALYPDKPWEFGTTLVNALLFPGAAEQGYTPSGLPWMLSYLDFGIVGVFVEGLVWGSVHRTIYVYYLKHRNSFFIFMVTIQLSLWQALPLCPAIFALTIFLVMSAGLRLRLRTAATPAMGST